MLMGHTDGFSESDSKDPLHEPQTELDDDGDGSDNDVVTPEEILYTATFDDLAVNYIKYDTIIWVSISLLLVLAWGVGIIMLLYLPVKRYVLKKDISSRKLYVTPDEIVYKVSRPSFIPFWREASIERRVPLSMVIDIIIEQGFLQSVYGIHTFRIESIARGKAAPVDELQLQGIDNPSQLRKVIIAEATKNVLDAGKVWKSTGAIGEGQSMSRAGSLTEGPPLFKSPSKSWKVTSSPRYAPQVTCSPRYAPQVTGSPRYSYAEQRAQIPGEVFLNKLEEMNKSVKKLELLIEKSQTSRESS